MARIDRLAEEAKQVLQTAAVLGPGVLTEATKEIRDFALSVKTSAEHPDRFGFVSPPRCAPQGETRESPTKPTRSGRWAPNG